MCWADPCDCVWKYYFYIALGDPDPSYQPNKLHQISTCITTR